MKFFIVFEWQNAAFLFLAFRHRKRVNRYQDKENDKNCKGDDREPIDSINRVE